VVLTRPLPFLLAGLFILITAVFALAFVALAYTSGTTGFDQTFTVDSTGDGPDAAINGNCDDGSGNCTLRAALQEAAAASGTSLVRFEIVGDGPHTIMPASELPPVGTNVTVNGYTQSGASANTLDAGQGTDAVLMIEIDGSNAGEGANGLVLNGTSALVQGLVINNFSANGILLAQGGAMNHVSGNFIGTGVSGTEAKPNGTGIEVQSSDNFIGNTLRADTNLISGNEAAGILISGNAGMNNVRRNIIGAAANGLSPLPNGSHGVLLTDGAVCNTIGGEPLSFQNIIAFNGGHGVALSTDAGVNNYIDPNITHSNAGLGIDLGDDGVTANDPGDEDTGPNNYQNFPVLESATIEGNQVTITGILDSRPNRAYNLFFFSNAECDPSGYGEGRTFLGSFAFFMGPTGVREFQVTYTMPAQAGNVVTASASDPESTSEFSKCIEAQGSLATPTPTGTPTPAVTPAPTPPTPPVTPFVTPVASLRGDTDCDLLITAVDALFVLRYVAGIHPFAECILHGDINCDNLIDSIDALGILRHLAQLPVSQEPDCTAIGDIMT
jgi:hypothetical protein